MSDLATRLLRAAASPQAGDADPSSDAIEDAALRQFELFGINRTTMDDIAKQAKVARVTLYRRFPGRNALVEAVMLRELQRFLAALDHAIDPYDDPEERLVAGFTFAVSSIRGHRLLQRLLETEPEFVLPHLTVHGAPFVEGARDYLAARLRRDLPEPRTPEELLVIADIVVRLLLSYLLIPRAPIDLDDPERARAFALRYLGPILSAEEPRPAP